VIDDRRHAVVRADLQKVIAELIAATDPALNDAIGQPSFLEQDRDFLAVRRRPEV
jgi:hypothetical protein